MNRGSLKQIFLTQLSSKFNNREIEQIFSIYIEDTNMSFPLNENQISAVLKDIAKLLQDVPIQYVVSNSRFYNLDLYVNDSVLIPRPETEEMVFLLKEKIQVHHHSVIDIGTGSGCIALLVKKLMPKLHVTAVDISEQALEIAKLNADRNELEVMFKSMNLLQGHTWKEQTYDIIISNPPYITYAEQDRMSDSTVKYEPELALFVKDTDPLIMYKHLASYAQKNLNKDGILLCEINDKYALETKTLFEENLNLPTTLFYDMQGAARFILVES